jgi:hypothetical protein
MRFLVADSMFIMKININCHGPRLLPNTERLDPPFFLLPTPFNIQFMTREILINYGFRLQDLQRVTCEKLELASHVTGLEEEVERSREELHHTRDQLDRLQQAGPRSF